MKTATESAEVLAHSPTSENQTPRFHTDNNGRTAHDVLTGPYQAAAAQAAAGAEAALDTWVTAEMAWLFACAEAVRTDYEAAVAAALAADAGRRRGKVAVRVRAHRAKRATPGACSIEWVQYYYVAGADGPQYRTRYLPHGHEDSYPASTFAGLVKPWQMRLIIDTERQMRLIRQRVKQVAGVRTQLRRVIRSLHDAPAPTEATEAHDG